jgi:hypothetical protein
MRNVEDSDRGANCGVLSDDAGVLDRHVPSTEVGSLGAKGNMAIEQGRLLQSM